MGGSLGPPLIVEKVVGGRGSFRLDVGTWQLEPGLTVVLGLNGAGKTTLLDLLDGRLPPRSGRIIRPATMSFVPAGARLDGGTRVERFIDYVAFLKGIPRRERPSEMARVVALTGLDDHAGQRAGQLSSGWRQRVTLACGLLGSPAVVLLDEPTSSLDIEAAYGMWRTLARVSRELPVVVSTHAAAASLEFGDQMLPVVGHRVKPPITGAALRADFR